MLIRQGREAGCAMSRFSSEVTTGEPGVLQIKLGVLRFAYYPQIMPKLNFEWFILREIFHAPSHACQRKHSQHRKSISERNLCRKNEVSVVLSPLSGVAEDLQEEHLIQSVWHNSACSSCGSSNSGPPPPAPK